MILSLSRMAAMEAPDLASGAITVQAGVVLAALHDALDGSGLMCPMHLGAEGSARLTELIQELKRTLSIVIIEHDMKFLFGLADRISVIHWGQVIAEGTPDALRDNPWVQRSNLGALKS